MLTYLWELKDLLVDPEDGHVQRRNIAVQSNAEKLSAVSIHNEPLKALMLVHEIHTSRCFLISLRAS